MSQANGLDIPLGRASAAGATSGDISLPKMKFRDLEGTVRFFEKSGQGIPTSFLESLRSMIVVSEEFDFIIEGNSLADSLDPVRSRFCNSKGTISGP